MTKIGNNMAPCWCSPEPPQHQQLSNIPLGSVYIQVRKDENTIYVYDGSAWEVILDGEEGRKEKMAVSEKATAMSYEKCYRCPHSKDINTGTGFNASINLYCEITGQSIWIDACPFEKADPVE